jgi:hypothetical protein
MTSMKGEGHVGAAGCLAVTCLTWPSVGSGGLARASPSKRSHGLPIALNDLFHYHGFYAFTGKREKYHLLVSTTFLEEIYDPYVAGGYHFELKITKLSFMTSVIGFYDLRGRIVLRGCMFLRPPH